MKRSERLYCGASVRRRFRFRDGDETDRGLRQGLDALHRGLRGWAPKNDAAARVHPITARYDQLLIAQLVDVLTIGRSKDIERGGILDLLRQLRCCPETQRDRDSSVFGKRRRNFLEDVVQIGCRRHANGLAASSLADNRQ